MSITSKIIAVLAAVLAAFLIYWYVSYLDNKIDDLQSSLNKMSTTFEQYKLDVTSVNKLSTELGAKLELDKNTNANLRNDVANNFSELRVKIDSVGRNTAAAIVSNAETARIAESTRQDYFNLRDQIAENNLMIIGWQKYYCDIIAPKNNTQYLCEK